MYSVKKIAYWGWGGRGGPKKKWGEKHHNPKKKQTKKQKN